MCHAAHQEAFADPWGFTPRDFDAWATIMLHSERFDPGLWCVARVWERGERSIGRGVDAASDLGWVICEKMLAERRRGD